MPNIKNIIERINNKPFNSNMTFKEIKSYLEYFGIKEVRIVSSHHIFKGPDGAELSVPSHRGKIKASYVKKAYEMVNDMEEDNK